MRHARVVVAGAFALSMALPAAAQTFKSDPDLFGQKKPAPRPPAVDWNWRPSADQKEAPRPEVICGMTLVPADPKVDPRMKATPPERGVAYAMRMVPPTVCGKP